MYGQISFWSFRGQRSVLETMRLAKEAGFRGIELVIGETGDLTPETSASQCHNLAKAAKAAGLKRGSVASSLLWNVNPASAKKANRERALEIVQKSLKVTAELGVTHLLILSGHVCVPWDSGAEVVPYDECFKRSIEYGKAVAKLARKAGVVACVENVWDRALLSPMEFKEFLQEVSSPYVRMYLDVGNVWNFGYPQHWVKIMGKLIQRVHVKDFKRWVGTQEGFCQLGDGDAPLADAVKMLKKSGYNGPVTAEILPPRQSYDEMEFLRTTAERLKKLMS